jgi:hypothetical protein
MPYGRNRVCVYNKYNYYYQVIVDLLTVGLPEPEVVQGEVQLFQHIPAIILYIILQNMPFGGNQVYKIIITR